MPFPGAFLQARLIPPRRVRGDGLDHQPWTNLRSWTGGREGGREIEKLELGKRGKERRGKKY